jgi:hypothetical protein
MSHFWAGFEKAAAPRWLKEFRKNPDSFMSKLKGEVWLKRVQGVLDANKTIESLPKEVAELIGKVRPLKDVTRKDFAYNNRYGGAFGHHHKGVLFAKDKAPHTRDLSYTDPLKKLLTSKNPDGTYLQYAGLVDPNLDAEGAKKMVESIRRGDRSSPAYRILGSKKKIDVAHNTDNAAPFAEGRYLGLSGLSDMNRPDAVFAWPAKSGLQHRHATGAGVVRSDAPKEVVKSTVPEREVIYRQSTFGGDDPEVIVPFPVFQRGRKA